MCSGSNEKEESDYRSCLNITASYPLKNVAPD